MKKANLIILLVLFYFNTSIAQQDPHYTQYMYNMNIINPAYASSKENLSFGLLYRKQWVDVEGAPATFSLAGSMPAGKNVGVGLSIISDKIGPVEENNVFGDFS
jgi:type IX secretion system PorP/SprF family membrane protein